jgi:hypothetical protein
MIPGTRPQGHSAAGRVSLIEKSNVKLDDSSKVVIVMGYFRGRKICILKYSSCTEDSIQTKFEIFPSNSF